MDDLRSRLAEFETTNDLSPTTATLKPTRGNESPSELTRRLQDLVTALATDKKRLEDSIKARTSLVDLLSEFMDRQNQDLARATSNLQVSILIIKQC